MRFVDPNGMYASDYYAVLQEQKEREEDEKERQRQVQIANDEKAKQAKAWEYLTKVSNYVVKGAEEIKKSISDLGSQVTKEVEKANDLPSLSKKAETVLTGIGVGTSTIESLWKLEAKALANDKFFMKSLTGLKSVGVILGFPSTLESLREFYEGPNIRNGVEFGINGAALFSGWGSIANGISEATNLKKWLLDTTFGEK